MECVTPNAGQNIQQVCLTSKCLCPLPISVSLPPMWIFSVDDVEDVPTLEGDAQLVARDVQVVVRVVRKVGTVVVLQTQQDRFTGGTSSLFEGVGVVAKSR